jgi:RNA polymerase sigma-70 factor (ECF subfamily)
MTVSEDFASLTGPFRGELLAHCYRMLGSAEEAEDLVQETYLRAWRSYAGFEGRSSVRTWLYRIATNVCLTAIERRGRRPLPSGLGAPADDPGAAVVAAPEVPWLQPFPDALLAAEPEDPAAVTASRAGIRLAFVAALQYLSARQRAVLILRDVLDLPAAEVADLPGTTTTAVNSGLRRVRAQLMLAEDELAEPAEPVQQAMLERFAATIENADVSGLAELLREDVVLEMPPLLTWFAGLDVTSRAQIQAATRKAEDLDILVNNAGIARFGDLSDPAALEQHLAVNLFGTYAVAQAFLPQLTRSRGAIVNNVSTMALAPLPLTPAYAISKAAAFNLTQSLRALLAGRGVRVHAVLTGPTDTDMTRGFDTPRPPPNPLPGPSSTESRTARRTSFPIPRPSSWPSPGAAARSRRWSARTRPS